MFASRKRVWRYMLLAALTWPLSAGTCVTMLQDALAGGYTSVFTDAVDEALGPYSEAYGSAYGALVEARESP